MDMFSDAVSLQWRRGVSSGT